MAIEICMPKLSDEMLEGTLLEWQVEVGDPVIRGQIVAEIETDKTTIGLEAEKEGVVMSLNVSEGETVPVATVLAILEPSSTQMAKALQPEQQLLQEDFAEEPAQEQRLVSPAAKKLAQDLEIDLESIQGSGPRGRIVLADVKRARPKVPAPAAAPSGESLPQGGGKSVKIRRLIARKMEEAWRTIPHFFVTMAVDMTDVIRFRKDLGVTINDFVLAASARALQEHPWVNATWNGERGVELPDINIAMAVATDRGLYNPVLHHCEKLTLKQISRLARDLAEKASNQGRLRPEEMEGGTFTITNMGMLGVESFSAIITPPQAATLAVGTVKGEIVVDDQGEPAVAPIMRLTLSGDHRVLDGADAAEFLDTIKTYLEAPIMLVTE